MTTADKCPKCVKFVKNGGTCNISITKNPSICSAFEHGSGEKQAEVECCDNRGEKMNKRHNDYLCDSCSPQYAFLYHDTLDKLTALTAEHEAEKTELEKKLEVMEAEYEKLKEVRKYIMEVSTATEEGKEIVDNVFEKSGGL